MYRDTELFIDGRFRSAADGRRLPVLDPATNAEIGSVAVAGPAELEEAVAAVARGFAVWRSTDVMRRSNVLRGAAAALRDRIDTAAMLLTLEQGKPLAEARAEFHAAADIFDWFAEEARRTYGRIIPARNNRVQQLVIREPVGPVAAFTPWNFPVSQTARKLGAALASGCSLIVKPPQETPAAVSVLAEVLSEAGLPAGAVNFVFGNSAEISGTLIPHPTIRKVSFTGSVPVGKLLAALAGTHMKPATMELGGHAPTLVFADADVRSVGTTMARSKFRNCGQVCVSPTRFLVEESIENDFIESFLAETRTIRVGPGTAPDTTMGPLINARGVAAIESLVADAVEKGAKILTGGRRIGNQGNYFEPTVLANVSTDMRVMNEEPFGPLAVLVPFSSTEEAISEANRLPFGLASYAFTQSASTISALERNIEAGMLSINHLGLALPETPFGGVKDSGYGSEGGSEAIEPYLTPKFVTKLV